MNTTIRMSGLFLPATTTLRCTASGSRGCAIATRFCTSTCALSRSVQRNGVVTRKNSPDILMVVFMLSPDDSVDQLYISNYALLQVRDQLLRLDGIGDIQMFGARDYSMRLWLDPDRIATLGL